MSTTSRSEHSSSIFFFPARPRAEGIHVILIETLGEHAPSYASVKNWVAHFKRGDFSTCDAPQFLAIYVTDNTRTRHCVLAMAAMDKSLSMVSCN
jgi:hypothetical protein